jgi:Flp pilus assembly protein TadD
MNSAAVLPGLEHCPRRNVFAEAEFRTALSLSPDKSQAHFKLGALYLSQGRKAEAMREYQAGLKSDPENRDALAAVEKLSSHVRAQ